MKICIVGSGAIGGLLGSGLATAGGDVTLLDTGAHLEAIQRAGLTVIARDGETRVLRDIKATDSYEETGQQDLVILAVKAHVIPDVAGRLEALYGPDTVVLTTQNGIPWWYFQRHGGRLEDWRLDSLDPDGIISNSIEPERVIGCVAYPAAALERPGVIRHLYGNRFPVGEPDGGDSARVRAIADLLVGAGFKSFVLDDIRSELWLKAVGVLAFNSLSALSRATMVGICRHPATRDLAMELMREAEAVADRLGITLRVPLERRLAGAEKVGEHKTSMLQDVEAGRSLEVDAVMGSVVEMGKRLGVPTPRIDTVFRCLKLLDAGLTEERRR